jgi:glycosyltransferase involved in cell wall biosynthesis
VTTPKVSAAIATYNRAAMVAQAIDSLLAQTRPPDEIVVVDDASTDATWEVLQDIALREPRLRIFKQELNCGGVHNSNRAFEETSGDVLAWCGDDDRWLPGHLEQSLAFLEAHPEIGLVHSGFTDAVETVDSVELVPRRLRAKTPLVIDRQSLAWYMTRYFDWPFHSSTLVLRREVWEQTGRFDPAYALADTDWFVRVAERFQVALLPVDGAINRRHAGNWSNRIGSARMQREIFEIVERAIDRSEWWRRPGWRAVWRTNARLRLLLTIRARIRTGHVDAAYAAWSALMNGTGRCFSEWLERAGERWIRRRCAGREQHFDDARQSVSPL